jgi:DNA-binding response OmpR family regulator/signal transduction histidine kinase
MSPVYRRPSILFVDDEADVVDILARTFEQTYEVATATSVAAALKILAARQVDLLVTDQKMPESTGIELVTRARAAGYDFTAILLTGYTDPQDLIDAINKGQVYRYITKPWDVTEFKVTVKNALDHHALRKERELLVQELSKRVDALNVLYEVSRSGTAPAGYEEIIGRVLEALPKVIPYDLAAALVGVEPGKPASLQLHCFSESSEAALLAAKEQALSAWARLSGVALSEDKVVMRVTGKRGLAGEDSKSPPLKSSLVAPLTIEGKPAGVIVLFASAESAFREDDARLLEVLANQTAGTMRNLVAVLGAERRRVERMVECMADGVILTDARNEIVVINPAARELLQIDEPQRATAKYLQEVLGFYPFELVRGWEYGGAQILREEVRIFERTLHSTVSPVTDAQGQLAGVVVVLRDISEQKKLEARKEEFVSILSHELRTPLTAISGALDLVLNNIAGEINEKQRRFLGMAKDSTDKLNTMVDDLLDLSKFARGKMRMSFEVIYLDDLVRAAVERYSAAAVEKRISMEIRLPGDPVKVVGDPNRLAQVLNNLLTNGIKFCTAGGRIEVGLKHPAHLGRFAVLSCWNDGEPIAEADLERIFEKFEQGGSVRTRTVRGTGLGLAICRSIVEAHGGRIWAESSEGKGARFVVVVPVEPGAELARPEEPDKPKLLAGAPKPGTVLVVDDEPDIAFILKALLLSRGHRALVAFNADEALALARKHHPDVVAADVRMPEVDGISLAEILRHDPETRSAKLLVVSVFDERERAFKAGASAFLQKPLDVPRFLATVDGLVAQKSGVPAATVLVVDDDPAIRAISAEVLRNIGYHVLEAGTMAEGRSVVREQHPDMLLLDILLPDGDGFAFLEELKDERAARHLSVIFITAKGETASKVRALKLGADDYLVKPFDALELAARVETVLRRKEAELGASPTTRLPGSVSIEREVMRRFEGHEKFGLCYLDLDNLKAYNDHYGYAKADGVVQQTGDLLREVVSPEHGAFLGHVAGDDFVFVVAVERVDEVCQQIIDAFDRIIPLYYDAEDRRRGYIEAVDRFGVQRRFPIMSVSVAAVINDGRFEGHTEISRAAADLKLRAKQLAGSKYLRSDRPDVYASRTRSGPVSQPVPVPQGEKAG